MNPHRPFLSLVLFSAALCAQTPEFRDLPPLTAVPADLLKAAAAFPKSPDTEAVILLSDFHYRFEPDGRYLLTQHLVVQAVTTAGATDWNSIREEWSQWEESRPKIRARVINPDGSVHELEQKT
jgi:hypothetical protein